MLFTDIEGSTRLLERLGPDRYLEALALHRLLLREAFGRHSGYEVDNEGDAFFVAFASAEEAVAAAAAGQQALARTDWPAGDEIRVRMGVHTGRPLAAPPKYVGLDVHQTARIMAAGHGGQVLVSQATRALVDGDLTDLGEHRLKDFAEPVAIFQLGEERFPPLKTISNTNLPRPASSFVGRERETAEVAELVRRHRLVTLSGPGGSGKTRLSIEAATELVGEFKAGVFWVGLATVRDPTLVLETVGQTLGANDGLADEIGERELLLLLDNLEQVVEASAELASLVEACPNLHLLVTSRELLRVRGELEYRVPPLAEPEAVTLFCERSGLDPGEATAELCRRLDNLPLGVELAAARTAVLTPPQILDRLAQRLDLLKGGRDAEARQQTLRATIEWSHDLLADDEKPLFARLSVFAGGCTLDAADEIVEADVDGLQSLVDKSLVRRTGERFWMLETIGEFAREQLRGGRRRQRDRSPACGMVPRARRRGRAVPERSRAGFVAAAPGGRARQLPREPRVVLRLRRCRGHGEAGGDAVAVLVHARPRHGGPPLDATSARRRPGRPVSGPRRPALRRRLPRLRAKRERGGHRPPGGELCMREGGRSIRDGRDRRGGPVLHAGRDQQ